MKVIIFAIYLIIKMKRLFLFTILLLFILPALPQVVVPSVESATQGDGYIQIQPGCINVANGSNCGEDIFLFGEYLPAGYDYRLVESPDSAVFLFIDNKEVVSEGYVIDISSAEIRVEAASYDGFVYATHTLRQIAVNDNGVLRFPCLRIEDAPRMAWRGFMLDSGRQFHSVATIKRYIEMASMLKMNIFHWHLTEGLGWRVEIKQYPLLTTVGAFVVDGAEQQGYYTQEDIKEIVEYAARRAITIVPEIDIPGHAEAALKAYPELSCFGAPIEIPHIGFTSNLFCAGKDGTLLFLKNVLDEICRLFPSPYIHLGGDEAPKENWDKCPDCQNRIAEQNLANSNDLQRWLSSQMAEYLHSKGRKVIFWEDALATDGYPLPDNVAIQWWDYRSKGDAGLKNATANKCPVIANSNYYTYLNFPVEPWRGYNSERTFSLSDVYENNPSYKAILSGEHNIMGMSCSLWTDYGLLENMLDERLFPRIFAIAEQMWYKGTLKPYDEFIGCLESVREWWQNAGYCWSSDKLIYSKELQ